MTVLEVRRCRLNQNSIFIRLHLFFSMSASHYASLGLPSSASNEDIKAAYRRLCLLHHPDRTGGMRDSHYHNVSRPLTHSDNAWSSEFVLIQQAWEVLRDEATRAQYDRSLRGSLAFVAHRWFLFFSWPESELLTQHAVSEEVDLSDMILLEELQESLYYYPCRCGERYIISVIDLDSGANEVMCEVLFECVFPS